MAINALLRYRTGSNNLSVVIIINFSVVVLKAYRLIFMPTTTAKSRDRRRLTFPRMSILEFVHVHCYSRMLLFWLVGCMHVVHCAISYMYMYMLLQGLA